MREIVYPLLGPTLCVGTRSSPLCGASTRTAWQSSGMVRAAERPRVRSHAERGTEEFGIFRCCEPRFRHPRRFAS
jgi:hypothetical protein